MTVSAHGARPDGTQRTRCPGVADPLQSTDRCVTVVLPHFP